MIDARSWPDVANAVVGACIAASPWVLGVPDNRAFMLVALTTGLLLLAVALGSILRPRVWEEWVQGALGLWLVVSPWILGFEDSRDATTVIVVAGLVAAGLAAWALLSEESGPGEISTH